MNKSELIDAVSSTTALAKRDVEDAVNAVVHTVMNEVRAGRRVAVVGFGSFNPTRRAARRFAEVVCPPGMRTHHRTDRVMGEFELTLGALAPVARRALIAAFVVLDQGARLYPRSRGRRFTRLDDQVAEAYIRALLARHGAAAQLVQRLRGLVVMCYYELPVVQREIGYNPAPYIAAVSRRRLESYGPQIRAGEAAVTAPDARQDQP